MRQATLSVALEVKPESRDKLSALLDRLHDHGSVGQRRRRRATLPGSCRACPRSHFLSMSVFPGEDY